MKRAGAIVAFLSLPVYAQDHSAHQHADMPAMPGMDTSAQEASVPQAGSVLLAGMHGDSLNYLLLGERFEWLPDQDVQQWAAQGWYGSDLHKLWVKTEGHYNTSVETLERAELQLLYSHALAPYWDLQAGVRMDTGDGPSRQYATVGVQGLAPYWFELNLSGFLSDQGDLGARVEADYDLRFTQRVFLQPRLELNYSASDDSAAGIGQGVTEAVLGLRLRYEIRREFAPYLGLEWGHNFGGTASLLERQGLATSQTSWVAGLRFWY